jgi:hypothetical protein
MIRYVSRRRADGLVCRVQAIADGPDRPILLDTVWVHQKLDALNQLLARDPAGARREIQKHVADLRIAPAPGQRVVRITGRAKVDGLLGAEEAVRLQLVAGAGFAECYMQPDTLWIDITP